MAQIQVHCKDCKFFQQAPVDPSNLRGPRGGICVRMPPTAIGMPTPQGLMVQGVFPPVQEVMGCGEFVPASPMFGTLESR